MTVHGKTGESALIQSAMSVVCAALTASARESHITSLCAALGTMHALFFSSSTHAARTARRSVDLAICATYRGHEQLPPTLLGIHTASEFIGSKGVAALRDALAAGHHQREPIALRRDSVVTNAHAVPGAIAHLMHTAAGRLSGWHGGGHKFAPVRIVLVDGHFFQNRGRA